MDYFDDYNEPDDPMDSPKYEYEAYRENIEYFEKLDDMERWSE